MILSSFSPCIKSFTSEFRACDKFIHGWKQECGIIEVYLINHRHETNSPSTEKASRQNRLLENQWKTLVIEEKDSKKSIVYQ